MIYLDNSATTFPKPPGVIRAVNSAVRQYGFNPGRGGYPQSVRTAKAVYDTRSAVKDFFGVSGEENVIFTSGCTESLNIAIKGVLRKGDHAVISSMEHNSVVRPVHKLSKSGYISYSVADASGTDEEIINSFRKSINERTRLFVCTHASNVFGKRLPAERLCALAHSYGILFCLDAAQTAGIFDIDLQRDGYDFVCCAGHKYLYGPMGIGLLLLGNDIIVDTLTEGGTGSESSDHDMPSYYPDRLEAGTLNIPGILGLKAGLDFVRSRGTANILDKERAWIKRLHRYLSQMDNIEVYGDYNGDDFAPVLSFTVKGRDSEEVARHLAESFGICVRSGLHCAPLAHETMGTIDRGTVRISPSVFTTDNDMKILINSLRNMG